LEFPGNCPCTLDIGLDAIAGHDRSKAIIGEGTLAEHSDDRGVKATAQTEDNPPALGHLHLLPYPGYKFVCQLFHKS